MPFLSIVSRALVETRSFTQRFSLGTQKRRSCRFGSHLRRVLLLACDTLLPDSARLPVTWQTFAIRTSLDSDCRPWPGRMRPGGCRKNSPETLGEPHITTESIRCRNQKAQESEKVHHEVTKTRRTPKSIAVFAFAFSSCTS